MGRSPPRTEPRRAASRAPCCAPSSAARDKPARSHRQSNRDPSSRQPIFDNAHLDPQAPILTQSAQRRRATPPECAVALHPTAPTSDRNGRTAICIAHSTRIVADAKTSLTCSMGDSTLERLGGFAVRYCGRIKTASAGCARRSFQQYECSRKKQPACGNSTGGSVRYAG